MPGMRRKSSAVAALISKTLRLDASLGLEGLSELFDNTEALVKGTIDSSQYRAFRTREVGQLARSFSNYEHFLTDSNATPEARALWKGIVLRDAETAVQATVRKAFETSGLSTQALEHALTDALKEGLERRIKDAKSASK